MLIYSLSSSSNTELVRYIGYTKKPLRKRLIEHLSDSKTMRTHKDKWIQKELRIGNKIIASELDSANDIQELKQKEVNIISLFKSFGARLVNGTNGGDGVVGLVHSEKFKEWNTKTKSKKIYYFDYSTKKLLGSYQNCRQMCEALKLIRSAVRDILSGIGNAHHGYTFSYNELCPAFRPRRGNSWNKGISTKGKQRFKATPIIAENVTSRLLFPSMNLACKFFNVRSHSIICVAIKNNRPYKGYMFKRFKKDFIPGTTYINI